MNVFEVKGFSGLMALLGSILLTILVVLALPSAFMMVLWNAMVFEGFGGPEVSMLQGVLLWMMVAIVFKLIFNPQIVFEFKKMDPPSHKDSDAK